VAPASQDFFNATNATTFASATIIRSGANNHTGTHASQITRHISDPATATDLYPNLTGTANIANVTTATVATLKHQWPVPAYNDRFANLTPAGSNDFEKGLAGQWRAEKSYIFRSALTQGATNKTTGTFTLTPFNYTWSGSEPAENNWLATNTINHYLPHGQAVQQTNPLNIASATQMGYGNSVAVASAQNATYASIHFDSFEDNPNLQQAGEVALLTDMAHSGSQSIQVAGNNEYALPTMQNDGTLTAKGILASLWAYQGSGTIQGFTIQITDGTAQATAEMTKIIEAGPWALYEVQVPGTQLAGLTGSQLTLKIINDDSGSVVFDDLKVQPLDASITCQVFDPATLKPLAIFDDQHIPRFYQYNGEGQLIRTMIETESGRRTVQETIYHTPTVNE